MNSPIQLTRDFSISDNTMLQDGRINHAQFVLDQADFVALDDDFKLPFETNWLAAIEDASKTLNDEQIVDVQTGLTAQVVACLEDCRAHFQGAKYYVEKAFENKLWVLNEFGYDNYEDVRRVPEKMITFMDVFSATANKYKAELLAAKYTKAQIDAIATKRQALIEAKKQQELGKNSRYSATQNRILLLNMAWGFRTKVAKAAKVIYADNYAKYKIYLLPASEEATSIYSIRGTVTDKATGKGIANVLVKNTTETTMTDSNGKYGFFKLPNDTYTLTFTIVGYKTATTTAKYEGTTLSVDIALEKL
jgi:hypothetical protein